MEGGDWFEFEVSVDSAFDEDWEEVRLGKEDFWGEVDEVFAAWDWTGDVEEGI